MKHWSYLAGIALLGVTGCASPQFVGREGLTIVDQTALPPPTVNDLAQQGRPYLIGPFDRMTVEVYGVQELSRSVQADANGQVALPLAGIIDAAGKTPGELAVLIAERLRGRYVRDPQVTVNLTEQVSQRITVSGEVEEPGLYPVLGRMTLMRAIATAKGLGEFARPNHVVVFRRVANQDMAALYDLRAIEQGIYPDPEVYANDVVMVGDSPARRLFRDVIQGSGLLTAPLIALIQS